MKSKLKDIILDSLAYVSPNIYCKYTFQNHRKGKFKNIEKLRLKGEPLLLEFLLKENDKLFDVGCHVGEYIFYCQGIIPSADIFAFEPNPTSFKRLKNVFKNSQIFNIALSSQNGTAQFKIPSVNKKLMPTRGTLRTDYTEPNEDSHLTISVKTQTIDSFVREHSVENIGLIKVDVEGFEIEVINGASLTIETQKPILILELEQRHIEGSLTDAIEKIKALNYQCYYFDIDSMGIKKLEDKAEDIQLEKYHMINPVRYVNNFIFIHNDSDILNEIEDINRAIKNESD